MAQLAHRFRRADLVLQELLDQRVLPILWDHLVSKVRMVLRAPLRKTPPTYAGADSGLIETLRESPCSSREQEGVVRGFFYLGLSFDRELFKNRINVPSRSQYYYFAESELDRKN